MSQPKIAVGLFFLAALLFLFVAILPALRDGDLNTTFFVLAIVFFILGIANFKKARHDSQAEMDDHDG